MLPRLASCAVTREQSMQLQAHPLKNVVSPEKNKRESIECHFMSRFEMQAINVHILASREIELTRDGVMFDCIPPFKIRPNGNGIKHSSVLGLE